MIDCCASNKYGLLSLQDALQQIHATITPINESETVSLKQALGRILAEPLYSLINIPAHRNSSVDGYALAAGGIDGKKPFTLKISGISWAGKPYLDKCPPGHCVRIFTGAIVPDGADCVIMQEQVTFDGDRVTFSGGIHPGENIRYPGEDVQSGELLMTQDKKLTAIDLGLLAAAGIYKIDVKRKPRIAFCSTGNELTALGNTLQPGQIYDSNRYTLQGLLQDPSHDITDLGVIADDKQQIKETLLTASRHHDVILTTGGASVGDADYIKQILDEIGAVNFWKIAMKPGKPLAYGKINNCCFFGLPGNPVSVIATYQQVVIPALQQLTGTKPVTPLRIKAQCSGTLKKSPGRQEFQRGILTQHENGEFIVKSAGKQSSNVLSSISQANCYIVLPAECNGVTGGEWVETQPFLNFK